MDDTRQIPPSTLRRLCDPKPGNIKHQCPYLLSGFSGQYFCGKVDPKTRETVNSLIEAGAVRAKGKGCDGHFPTRKPIEMHPFGDRPDANHEWPSIGVMISWLESRIADEQLTIEELEGKKKNSRAERAGIEIMKQRIEKVEEAVAALEHVENGYQ